MSPYLFVLCMERLSMMILQKVDSSVWKPIWVIMGGIEISHPLFANDILLLWRPNRPR